jgi:hypothetical protein
VGSPTKQIIDIVDVLARLGSASIESYNDRGGGGGSLDSIVAAGYGLA